MGSGVSMLLQKYSFIIQCANYLYIIFLYLIYYTPCCRSYAKGYG